jgi:hypothetical protein
MITRNEAVEIRIDWNTLKYGFKSLPFMYSCHMTPIRKHQPQPLGLRVYPLAQS